ncbi:MAG: NUDIX hydrolase N-terminal domain-containing protein [Proteobacteria bacterium]|nr:NUDIX hydrolase N-terminal domain-containing protein [Pseudomonadota bacterium]
MKHGGDPAFLHWAKRLQAMAQTGLTYAQDPYDIARYNEMIEIAAEMIAHGAGPGGGIDAERVRAVFAHETGHATPKLDVRAAAFRRGAGGPEVLLVREKSDGRWTLPGGWADPGETPSQAAAREAMEESGYAVRITRVLAVWDKRAHPHPPDIRYVYKICFEAEATHTDGSGGDGKETDGVGFFARDAIPDLSLPRILPGQLQALFDLHEAGPSAPALFD